MKEKWFIEWLKDESYSFWYEYNENEVWVNTKFTLIWHPAHGVKHQIPNEMASEEYISKCLGN